MARFEKTIAYDTKIPSYTESGRVEYETSFSLSKEEWKHLADALEKSIDADSEPYSNYSESEVLVLGDKEVTVFKDTTYFGDSDPAICIWDGDIMGTHSLVLTIGAANDLIAAIRSEIL